MTQIMITFMTSVIFLLLLIIAISTKTTHSFVLHVVSKSKTHHTSPLLQQRQNIHPAKSRTVLFASFTPSDTNNNSITTDKVIQSENENDVSHKTKNHKDHHVSIHVEHYFPNITPTQAKDAWVSYQWEQGGGLFGIVIQTIRNDQDNNNDNAAHNDTELSSCSYPPKRVILPLGMEETIVFDSTTTTTTTTRTTRIDSDYDGPHDNHNKIILHYKVTQLGFVFENELVPNSHFSTVEFSSCHVPPPQKNKDKIQKDQKGTKMIWNVDFDTQQRSNLWKFITLQNIETVSNNLGAHLAPPLHYQRITHLIVPHKKDLSLSLSDIQQDILQEWIDFIWYQGGGLPVLPPVQLSNTTRMYVPPFLQEQIQEVHMDETNNHYEITYRVVNPNLIALHTHSGSIRFVHDKENNNNNNNNRIDMIWDVHVRPFHGCHAFVQWYISTIITTLARNFKNHIEEPNATVPISPPRGGGGTTRNNQVFMTIPKHTWLGGVMDAHLHDSRSTLDQTISMFQPWTWGRTLDSEGEGEEWIQE